MSKSLFVEGAQGTVRKYLPLISQIGKVKKQNDDVSDRRGGQQQRSKINWERTLNLPTYEKRKKKNRRI